MDSTEGSPPEGKGNSVKGLYLVQLETSDSRISFFMLKDDALDLYQKYGALADQGYDDSSQLEIEAWRDITRKKSFKSIIRFEYLVSIYIRETDSDDIP